VPHDHDHAGHSHGPVTHGHALNLRGAWLHLVGDTLGALAALAAAIVIKCGGPDIVDPLGSILVALVLIVGAGKLLWEATLVLMEAAPLHLPAHIVRDVIQKETGVLGVVDLRVWTLGAGHDAVAAEVRASAPSEDLAQRIAVRLRQELHVEQVTVQITNDP
jgi:cobalt-zinc-cadmium efflux system protein